MPSGWSLGRLTQAPATSGMRPTLWAARSAMLEVGVATEEDVARWESAYLLFDKNPGPQTMFIPIFAAIGRKG